MMNAKNTKKFLQFLKIINLKKIPEAHNYLMINGEIKDFTKKGSNPENFVNELVEETRKFNRRKSPISKVGFHQNFLKKYLKGKS